MKKLKIGYFADGPWSHKTFELLINDKELEIAFIIPRKDSADNNLSNFAEKFNIPIFRGVDINSDSFYEMVLNFNCDLFVSMSFNQIFKPRITNLPLFGTINCHAGKLPFYRGRNILNWALINDEKDFGITVHFIDEGIDTGDIILQKTFLITDKDTYGTLLNLAYSECAIILYEAVKCIQTGNFKRIKQNEIHPFGFYCGKRKAGDEFINWNQTSRELFNFIRALSKPGPVAETKCGNSLIKINRAKIFEEIPSYKCLNGQIVGKTKEGFLVKTSDTAIEILEINSEIKLKIGDRLGI